eukprot:354839-Chlamydomonas_euryale.AAC.3
MTGEADMGVRPSPGVWTSGHREGRHGSEAFTSAQDPVMTATPCMHHMLAATKLKRRHITYFAKAHEPDSIVPVHQQRPLLLLPLAPRPPNLRPLPHTFHAPHRRPPPTLRRADPSAAAPRCRCRQRPEAPPPSTHRTLETARALRGEGVCGCVEGEGQSTELQTAPNHAAEATCRFASPRHTSSTGANSWRRLQPCDQCPACLASLPSQLA